MPDPTISVRDVLTVAIPLASALLVCGAVYARGEDTRASVAALRSESQAERLDAVRLDGRLGVLERREEARPEADRRAWEELRAIREELVATRSDLRAVCAATKSTCGASR